MDKRQRSVEIGVFLGALIMTIFLGWLDYLTQDLSFIVLYIIPVALTAWWSGRWPGLAMAVLASASWITADTASIAHVWTSPVAWWDAAEKTIFYPFIAFLTASTRRALDRERENARIDFLTGAVNSRFFSEILLDEIARARRYRHDMSVAYLDADNFKEVNDRLGHSTGDQLLRLVVDTAKRHLRVSDTFARMGGDEFVLLLPETDGPRALRVVRELRGKLLDAVRSKGWPVTFSIGLMTCGGSVCNADQVIRHADAMMYRAKRAGKNRIFQRAWQPGARCRQCALMAGSPRPLPAPPKGEHP